MSSIPQTVTSELRRELEAAGVFRHRPLRTGAKFAFLLTVSLGLVACALVAPWWGALLIAPVAGLFAASAAMIGHEGAHRSFAATAAGNEILAHLAFPLFSGLGLQHWKNKHNRCHHGYPNVETIDDDVNLWPMTTSATTYGASGPLRRLFQRRVQGFAFWPLTFLLATVMRLQSIMYLVSRVRAGRFDRAAGIDALCLALHYGMWIAGAGLLFGWAQALLVYLAVWAWVGLYLALIFTPAHMGLPIHADMRKGWLHQLETTRNLTMSQGLAFFVCGLNHQIEHHLFPKIPHQNLPMASRIVAAWCQRHGLPHQQQDFGRAVVGVTRFMHRAWAIPAEGAAPGLIENAA